MNKKMMHEFICDFWIKIIKPTCEASPPDWEYMLRTGLELEEKYPDIRTMVAEMYVAYAMELERRHDAKTT